MNCHPGYVQIEGQGCLSLTRPPMKIGVANGNEDKSTGCQPPSHQIRNLVGQDLQCHAAVNQRLLPSPASNLRSQYLVHICIFNTCHQFNKFVASFLMMMCASWQNLRFWDRMNYQKHLEKKFDTIKHVTNLKVTLTGLGSSLNGSRPSSSCGFVCTTSIQLFFFFFDTLLLSRLCY